MPMKVFFHDDFYQEYTSDPAAESGRMEAIVKTIQEEVTWMRSNQFQMINFLWFIARSRSKESNGRASTRLLVWQPVEHIKRR